MAISKGRALSATVNSASSIIKSSIDGTTTISTLEQSAQQYANAAALPSVGNTFGEMALVQSTNRMYVWNGSGWYNVALINTNPTFTTSPSASYEFDADSPRSNITITVAASDPESLGVSFSFETGGSMDSMASVTQDSSVFTLVPKGNDSLTDGVTLTGSLTIKATDGVNIVPEVSSFTLAFITIIENSSGTNLLLKASGTGDNNAFDDKSTTNHVVTASGTVTQGTFSPFRHGGYSIEFDAYGDEIEFPDIAAYDIGTSQFSVEAWVYPTAGVNNYSCGIIAQFASASRGWGMTFNNTQIKFYGSSNGGSSTNTVHTATYTVPHFQWSHIVTTRDDTNIRIFVNGQLILAAANTAHYHNSTQPLRIGEANSGTAENFKGFMKDIRLVVGSIPTEYQTTSTTVNTRIFTPPTETLTAISGTQLLTGNSYYIKDGSSNNATPAFNGSPTVAGFSPYDHKEYSGATNHYSALFDGNSDYLTYPNSTEFQLGTGDFTVEAWLYPNSIPGGGVDNDMTVFGHFGSPTMFFYISNNTLTPTLWNGSNGYGSSIACQLKAWNHVAWVRESSTLKIYVNGVLGVTQASYTTNFNASTAPLTGKSSANSTRYFNGYIADLRVVKGTAVYSSAFTPPTAPLTAVTNTKLLMSMSDAKVIDASQNHNFVLQGTTVASSGQQHFSENTIALDANSDYIELDQVAIPITSEEDYTIDLWFYSGDTGRKDFVNQYLVSQNGRMALYSESAKIKFFQHGWNGTVAITGPTSWTTNTWHHIALQNSSQFRNFYLDGNHEGGAYTAGADIYNINTKIGALNLSGSLQGYINGYMHDVRITRGLARFPYISKPVTLTQTNSGMEKPDGTTPTATASNTKLLAFTTSTITAEGSASPHTLTASGSAASSLLSPATGMHSAYFANGDADFVSAPASADHQIYGGDYTVEAWLYPTAFNASFNYFLSKGGSPSAREWAFSISASDIRAYWSTNGASSGDTAISASCTNHLNRWVHVAFVKSGTAITIYKNGSFISSGTFNSIHSGNGVLTISRLWQYTGISHSYDGYISNLRIVKGQALYSKNFTPLTTALKG